MKRFRITYDDYVVVEVSGTLEPIDNGNSVVYDESGKPWLWFGSSEVLSIEDLPMAKAASGRGGVAVD